MPGLGTLGTIVAGAISGFGVIFILWWRLKQAAQDKADADTRGSYIAGKVQAEAAEKAASDASNDAKNNAGADPTDW